MRDLIESAWTFSIASNPKGPSARNEAIAGCDMDGFAEIASCASFSFAAMGSRESGSNRWKDSKAFSIRMGADGSAPQLRIAFKSAGVTVSAGSEFDWAARSVVEKLRRRAAEYRCIFMSVGSHGGR